MMSKKVIREWIADNKEILADLESSANDLGDPVGSGYDEVRLEIIVLEAVLK